MRKTAGQALEARVQRLESVLLALDADLRAKLNVAAPARSDLFEPPASLEDSRPDPVLSPPTKTR